VRLSSNGRVVLGAGSVLAAVLALLFWRALFQDRVLAPTDIIFTSAFFGETAPPGFSRPRNPLLFDQVYQFAPWRRFTRELLKAGELPLWNPYSLAGTPLVATQQSAVFYPINLLLLAVPFERTFVWSAILRLWTAGMLTFLLARRLRLAPLPSLIAALGFMLSGFLIVGIGHPHTGVAIWLPGIALAVEVAVAARTRAAVFRAIALLALILGVQFTGGHLETSLDMLFGCTIYLLIRWRQVVWAEVSGVGARLRPLLAFAAGVGLGIGVGAMQLFPFLEWVRLSEEAGNRAAASGAFVLFDPGFWKQLLLLPLFLFPNIYNKPTWDPPYFNFLPWGHNYHSDILYVGVLTFLLAFVALARSWKASPVVRAWAIVGLITMGRALHLPVFDWINQLPLIEFAKAHMLRLLGSFSVCILAGFGAEALFGEGKGSDRATGLWRGLCIAVVVGGIGLMLIGKLVLPANRDRLAALDRQLAEYNSASNAGEPRSPTAFEREGRRMAENTIDAFRLRNPIMYAPAAIAAGALLIGWMAGRRQWSWQLQGMLVALSATDLLAFAWNYNPTISRSEFYPAPPIVAELARDTTMFRFSATRRDLTADAHMMFGLYDIRGLDFPTRWYATYAKLAPEHVAWRKITFDGFESPLLRVLNLKYVFAREDRVPLSGDRVERVIPTQGGRLWQLRNPQPRSFMVYRARAVRTDEEAAGLLREKPEGVFSRVLLSTEHNELPNEATDSGGTAEVRAIEYGPRRSAWRVRTDRPGYLFTGDAFYPGWKAELDGRPVTLYRANIAFRSVYVPQGQHVVVHHFDPISVRVGLAVAAISVLSVAALLIAARVAERRV
jgi:hypothetical protein